MSRICARRVVGSEMAREWGRWVIGDSCLYSISDRPSMTKVPEAPAELNDLLKSVANTSLPREDHTLPKPHSAAAFRQ